MLIIYSNIQKPQLFALKFCCFRVWKRKPWPDKHHLAC